MENKALERALHDVPLAQDVAKLAARINALGGLVKDERHDGYYDGPDQRRADAATSELELRMLAGGSVAGGPPSLPKTREIYAAGEARFLTPDETRGADFLSRILGETYVETPAPPALDSTASILWTAPSEKLSVTEARARLKEAFPSGIPTAKAVSLDAPLRSLVWSGEPGPTVQVDDLLARLFRANDVVTARSLRFEHLKGDTCFSESEPLNPGTHLLSAAERQATAIAHALLFVPKGQPQLQNPTPVRTLVEQMGPEVALLMESSLTLVAPLPGGEPLAQSRHQLVLKAPPGSEVLFGMTDHVYSGVTLDQTMTVGPSGEVSILVPTRAGSPEGLSVVGRVLTQGDDSGLLSPRPAGAFAVRLPELSSVPVNLTASPTNAS